MACYYLDLQVTLLFLCVIIILCCPIMWPSDNVEFSGRPYPRDSASSTGKVWSIPALSLYWKVYNHSGRPCPSFTFIIVVTLNEPCLAPFLSFKIKHIHLRHILSYNSWTIWTLWCYPYPRTSYRYVQSYSDSWARISYEFFTIYYSLGGSTPVK